MNDSICLIPPEYFIADKSYSNIVEFAFRNSIISDYLRASHTFDRIRDGNCSDFDVLTNLIDHFRKNSDTASRAYRYFSRVLSECFDVDAKDVVSGIVSAEAIWHDTADALLKRENTLFGIISRGELDSIGVAQTPWEYKSLPDKIGNTKLVGVMCPLGARKKSVLDEAPCDDFADLRGYLERFAAAHDNAVLFDELDFEFCEPNLYASSLAYEKYRKGMTLKNSELNILKTQLLRDTFFSCAENEGQLFLILPDASNVSILYQTEQLLDYIDGCISMPVKTVLFAQDVVGFSFALARQAKGYKKITVEAAIGGDDRYLMNDDDVKYWGVGRMPDRMASLSDTPAYIGKIIC